MSSKTGRHWVSLWLLAGCSQPPPAYDTGTQANASTVPPEIITIVIPYVAPPTAETPAAPGTVVSPVPLPPAIPPQPPVATPGTGGGPAEPLLPFESIGAPLVFSPTPSGF